MTGWNFGDLLEGLESVIPGDALASFQGDTSLSWSELSRQSNNLAAGLLARGVSPGDKVAFYMRNRIEYLVCLVACLKARLVHVNVNYRYVDDELHYILDNSDAAVVLFGAEFSERCERLVSRLPKVGHWLQADPSPPSFAESLQTLCDEGHGAPLGIERSPDDLLFVYTGGTTGMPKGVMWRQEDLWGAFGAGKNVPANRGVLPKTQELHLANVADHGPGIRQIAACPLMHGTGLFTSMVNLSGGGCVGTLTGESFDPVELFDAIERWSVESVVIVGDAFAKPMLNALDENPGRWSLPSLKTITSSGVMWSLEVKQGLLRHCEKLMLADLFGSTEAIGFGSSVTSKEGTSRTAKFSIGEDCRVFTEDHRKVVPGSDERGFIARKGPIPLGYYKDEKKTAETFPTIEGVRYSVPGDWCTVAEDGTLTLLGRGSVCINSAGEKIYPEEVEEALKTHPDVEDALVVGVPDEKWGQATTAVVALGERLELDEEALRQHVRERLAPYKTPKRVLGVPKMFRAPNGKADYRSALAFAKQELDIPE
ncbi:acyl-CoA synthetase [Myxococcota bacterium]|nr:acyl-CoA synthetase [Myxococcota bacterium]